MDLSRAREVHTLALDAEAHAADDQAEETTARLAWCAHEIPGAVDVLLEAGEDSAAMDLLGALSVFWQDTGRVGEGRALTVSALARSNGDLRSTARAQLVVGELAFRQGDPAEATRATTAALELAQQCDETWVQGRAELNLSRVAFRDGDAAAIAAHADRVAAAAGDNERLRAGAVHMQGWAAYTAGDVAGAMARFEDNADRYLRMGDRVGAASELANLADLAAESGDLAGATRYLVAAFDVPAVGDNHYLAPSLIRSAGVLLAQGGQSEPALRLLAAADQLYEEFGLTADPGDDVSASVEADARAAAGERAAGASRDGRLLTLAQAFEEAAEALRRMAGQS